MASPRLTGNRVRCIEVPQREGPVPRGRWTELLRPLLIARLNRPAQHNELFGLICEHLAQPAHRLIPDVDPEAFGIFSAPASQRLRGGTPCDCAIASVARTFHRRWRPSKNVRASIMVLPTLIAPCSSPSIKVHWNAATAASMTVCYLALCAR